MGNSLLKVGLRNKSPTFGLEFGHGIDRLWGGYRFGPRKARPGLPREVPGLQR